MFTYTKPYCFFITEASLKPSNVKCKMSKDYDQQKYQICKTIVILDQYIFFEDISWTVFKGILQIHKLSKAQYMQNYCCFYTITVCLEAITFKREGNPS
jgi:hypothetical protein